MPGRRSLGLTLSVWLAFACCAIAGGIFVWSDVRGSSELEVRSASPQDAIELTADWSQEWKTETEYVGLFRGHCELLQGNRSYSADKMVIWSRDVKENDQRVQTLVVYLEENVSLNDGETIRSESSALIELESLSGVTLTVRARQTDQSAMDDPVYSRASKRRQVGKRGQLRPAQFTVENAPNSTWQSVPLASPQALRRVRVFPRSSLPFDVESRELTNRTPPEQVTSITGGVTIHIYGLTVDQIGELGPISLSADRALIWTDAHEGTTFSEDNDLPLGSKYQVYLEGNIVVRQGDNVVTADQAYYDAQEDRALVLNADLRSFVPMLGATVRIRADRLRQNSESSFHARNAWITASEYGKPGYRLQASDVYLDQRPENIFGYSRPAIVNPETGQLETPTNTWVTAIDTRMYVDDIPVFDSPYFSGSPEDISTPLTGVLFQQDRIFGTQLLTKWDAFRLFSIDRPENVRWNLSLNYLSNRGPSGGTDGSYEGVDPWGNPFQGMGLASYINDSGDDNLGFDRRALVPPDTNRGRFTWRHKSYLGPGTTLLGEIGYISDRNYLEQYYEPEFDRGKDQETLGYLKHQEDNWAWSILARPQTNPFEYNTQWLPRGDITVLNEPLLNSVLNWSMHSSVGYASLNNVQLPTSPNDLFTPLPYYNAGQGVMAMTRHEVDAPFNIGALKISPYVLGDASYWGDSFNNDSVARLYGRTGLRASLMAWKAMPWVQSDFFNLNGLAHKMVFNADYGIAGSTEPLSSISQWNEFDDNSQERFRERLLVNTFGGVLPAQYDPRFYAVRSAAATSVSAPYNELVDTQHMLALGWSQRLQTKSGPPDQLRLKDWMTLDLGVNYYPAANRDNFGQDFGLFSSRYAWHVGDRTSILANSLYDFFSGGQELWNIGVLSQRSFRGSVYVGVRQVRGGPLDSQIATMSYSYVMTPDKWLTTMTTAFDLAEHRNAGQAFTLTRIGADFLIHLGFNYDASKNNVGATISVEPRFGSLNTGIPQFNSLSGVNR